MAQYLLSASWMISRRIIVSNPYRLRSTDLFTRIDDTIKELPKRIFFLSVEGNVTEVDYFRHIEKFKEQLGINDMVFIDVVRRANTDTSSDPYSVLSLLEEIVNLHDHGFDYNRLHDFLPEGYDIEFVQKYIENPELLSTEQAEIFSRKLQGKGLDLSYFRFISQCDKNNDVFCILIDRDAKNHDRFSLSAINEKCRTNGYDFYLTAPCFEFWLLLHLCNVKNEYSNKLDDIATNLAISNKHIFISNEVSKIAHHSKHISEKAFRKYYLWKVNNAVEQAESFENDINNLINIQSSIGTNLHALFHKLGIQ